jgi:hypothetical protein
MMPRTIKANCLNRYTSVLPLYILYAKEPVALYTTSSDVIASRITIPQIYLSPLVFLKNPPPIDNVEGLSENGLSENLLI